jgi:Tol biopolymer transport system component
VAVGSRVVAGTLSFLLLLAGPAGAQYFGRNKIQYTRFDFRILETPHFDIYYYSAEREAAALAARLAERWYGRLALTFDHTFSRRQPIILYASHGHFAQTGVVPGFVSDGVGGLTDHQVGRVVLPFAAGLGETDHVLGHELVHAFQRDILRQRGRAIGALPLWFIEGMAEYLSVGGVDSNTAMWLRDAVARDRLPRIDELEDPRWFPYRYGQALWAHVAERYGHETVAAALKSRAPGGAIGRLTAVTGVKREALSRAWHAELRERFAAPSAPGDRETQTIVTPDRDGGRLNVAPSLSPDGAFLVFLSERDQHSVDAYLADAASGAIVRKLLSTAADPHFDSIQFIESSGAWSVSGQRFALATLRDGEPVLTVFAMPEGTIVNEIPVRQVDQLFTPSWSPDGTRIVFSALKGGLTDLYVVDVATGCVEQLTSDAFADLQPAWSPDGRRIAFVTDRFSSSLPALMFGDYRLATIDPATREIAELPSLAGAKNIDPHWSQDGASLLFVADRDGISNVQALNLPSGEISAITTVDTGVSGVTSISPSLSVAAKSGTLAFSVYRDGAYEIRTTPPPTMANDRLANVEGLLPAHQLSTSVLDATPDHDGHAPAGERTFADRPYARTLSLVSIGQPYLSAGGGAFGGFVRGGISFTLGDMLAQQQLETAIQAGKDAADFALQTQYLNRRSRWTWGILGGQVPSTTGLSRTAVRSDAASEPTIARKSIVSQQIHRQLAGVIAYPFSRAQRLEFSAGVDAIGFQSDVTTSLYSATTGRLLEESRERGTAAAPATLLQTDAALIFDTAVHGPTSPVMGQRYRFAVAPTFGDLNLLTVVADYRRYVMPVRPFTLAVRVQHVGRYGSDADDPRLLPFVWIVQDVVRGYSGRALPAPGCAVGRETCEVKDVAGTRQLVAANVELRFPIVGLIKRTPSYGPLPIEALVFSDNGSFWVSGSPADGTSTRTLLRTVGAGIRLNAAGFVFELNASRPLEGSSGWRFGAAFRPGF